MLEATHSGDEDHEYCITNYGVKCAQNFKYMKYESVCVSILGVMPIQIRKNTMVVLANNEDEEKVRESLHASEWNQFMGSISSINVGNKRWNSQMAFLCIYMNSRCHVFVEVFEQKQYVNPFRVAMETDDMMREMQTRTKLPLRICGNCTIYAVPGCRLYPPVGKHQWRNRYIIAYIFAIRPAPPAIRPAPRRSKRLCDDQSTTCSDEDSWTGPVADDDMDSD